MLRAAIAIPAWPSSISLARRPLNAARQEYLLCVIGRGTVSFIALVTNDLATRTRATPHRPMAGWAPADGSLPGVDAGVLEESDGVIHGIKWVGLALIAGGALVASLGYNMCRRSRLYWAVVAEAYRPDHLQRPTWVVSAQPRMQTAQQ